MEKESILVVDDDKEIAQLVEIHLVTDGYTVYKAYNGQDGIELLQKHDIQLAIIDVMMPGMDGLEMCKRIRSVSAIPIIMLSAKSSDLDKIRGLGTGADDYVSKPFSPLELTARVKSQLRRFTKLNPSAFELPEKGDIVTEHLVINKAEHRVTAYDKEVKLTPIEFDIVCLLASNLGKVFSTEEIFETVWNEKMFEANNTVMVHIRRLREKIEMDSRNAQIIKTVWGVGYKIDK